MAAAIAPGRAFGAGFSGSAGLLSDKVVYGNSQSGGRSSQVLDLSYRNSTGWAFSGGLASLGRGAAQADAEVTLTAARGGPVGTDAAWQAAVSQYSTLGTAAGVRRPGYSQVALGYGWAEQLQLTALTRVGLVGPAPGGGRRRGQALILDASWHQPLGQRWGLDLGLGHVDYARLAIPSYTFASVSLSKGWGPVQVFATRIHSNSQAPNVAGPRAVVSVLWSF